MERIIHEGDRVAVTVAGCTFYGWVDVVDTADDTVCIAFDHGKRVWHRLSHVRPVRIGEPGYTRGMT